MHRSGSVRGRPPHARGSISGAGSVASGGDESSAQASSSTASSALFGLGEVARLVQETVFGVVAVMKKGSERKLRWAILETAIVAIQYIFFPLQLFSWDGIAWAEEARRIIRLAVPFRLSSFSFQSYLAVFWTAASVVAACLGVAFYVGYAFAHQDFRFMLPLRLLRFAVSNVVGIAYMPLISVFSSVFNCPAPGTSPAVHLYFPADLTRAAPRPALASAPDLPQLLFFETDYYKTGPEGEREYFSRPHSRVDAFFFVNNVLLSVLINLEAVPRPVIAVLFVASGALYAFLLLEFYPYHRLGSNQLQTGLAFAFTYASFVCFLDTQMRGAPPVALQAALLAGLVPAFLAGCAVSWARYRLRMCTGEAAAVAALRRPLHVEIAARFVYEAGPEDEEAVQVAEAIYRAGVEKFPASAAPLLAYAQFCYTFKRSPELGHARVRQAAKLNPGFDLRFVIYRKDLERQQSANAVDLGEGGRDLITHIEYTSNLTGAKKYHRLAVRSVRKFWGTLAAAEGEVDVGALEATLARVDAAERRAHAHYRALLSRYPRAPRILRAYGRFQTEVLNDEAAAQSFFEQADACEVAPAPPPLRPTRCADGGGQDARLAEAAGPALGEGAWEGPAPGSHPNAPSVASRNSLAGGARRHPGRASLLASAALGFFARRLVRPGPASAKYEAAGGRDSPAFSNSPGLSPRSRSGSALPSFVAQPPRSFGASSGGRGAGPGAVAPAPTGSVRLSRSVALSNGPAAVMGPAEGPGGARRSSARPGAWAAEARGPASLRSLAETRRDASAAAGAEGGEEEAPDHDRDREEPAAAAADAEPRTSLGPDPEDSEPASEAELERALAIGKARGARSRSSSQPRARLSWDTGAAPALALAARGPVFVPIDPVAPSSSMSMSAPMSGARAAWGAPAGDADAEAGPSASKHKDEGEGEGEGEGASGLAALARILDLDAGGEELEDGERGEGYSEQERGRRERRWVKVKRRLQGTALAHDASIRRMKRTVVAVLVAVFALAVAAFVVVGDLVRDYEQGIKQTGASGSRRKNAVLLALNAQSLLLAGVLPFDAAGTLEGRAREALAAAADELEARHLSVHAGGARLEMDSSPSTGLRIFKNDEGEVADVVEPLWVAGLQLVSNGRRVARAPLAALRNASHAQRELFFLRENGPRLYDAFNAATALVDERAYKSFLNIRVFLIAMFASVTGLLLVLAFGFFRPTVATVQREKSHALGLFRDIPRASAKRLARRGRRGQDPSAANESEAGRRAPAPPPQAADAAGEREREGRDRRRRRSSLLKGAPAPAGDAKPDLEAARGAGAGPGPPAPAAASAPASAWAGRGGLAGAGRLGRRARRASSASARPTPSPSRGGRGAQYAGAFLLLWALFLVWFAVGFETSTSCETFSTERNFAGLLRSLPVRVAFHARELALGAGDYAEQRAMLGHSIDRLERVHRSLLFGNRSAHLNGAIHRYHPADRLLFGSEGAGAGAGGGSGEGLQAQLLRFLEEARVLHASRPVRPPRSPAPRPALRPAYARARRRGTWPRVGGGAGGGGAIKGPLQPGLQRLADLFVEEATLRLEAFLALQTAMFAAVVALLLLEYLFVFRRIIGTLTDESRRTLFMFLMLPPEAGPTPAAPAPRASTGAALRRAPRQVIEATESIKAHLFRLLSSMNSNSLG
eukprot:tig00021491_g21764.t1